MGIRAAFRKKASAKNALKKLKDVVSLPHIANKVKHRFFWQSARETNTTWAPVEENLEQSQLLLPQNSGETSLTGPERDALESLHLICDITQRRIELNALIEFENNAFGGRLSSGMTAPQPIPSSPSSSLAGEAVLRRQRSSLNLHERYDRNRIVSDTTTLINASERDSGSDSGFKATRRRLAVLERDNLALKEENKELAMANTLLESTHIHLEREVAKLNWEKAAQETKFEKKSKFCTSVITKANARKVEIAGLQNEAAIHESTILQLQTMYSDAQRALNEQHPDAARLLSIEKLLTEQDAEIASLQDRLNVEQHSRAVAAARFNGTMGVHRFPCGLIQVHPADNVGGNRMIPNSFLMDHRPEFTQPPPQVLPARDDPDRFVITMNEFLENHRPAPCPPAPGIIVPLGFGEPYVQAFQRGGMAHSPSPLPRLGAAPELFRPALPTQCPPSGLRPPPGLPLQHSLQPPPELLPPPGFLPSEAPYVQPDMLQLPPPPELASLLGVPHPPGLLPAHVYDDQPELLIQTPLPGSPITLYRRRYIYEGPPSESEDPFYRA